MGEELKEPTMEDMIMQRKMIMEKNFALCREIEELRAENERLKEEKDKKNEIIKVLQKDLGCVTDKLPGFDKKYTEALFDNDELKGENEELKIELNSARELWHKFAYRLADFSKKNDNLKSALQVAEEALEKIAGLCPICEVIDGECNICIATEALAEIKEV